MNRILQLALLASVWVLTQPSVLAADQNSFKVVAKDKDGNPKPGITLSVLSGGNKFPAGDTDNNGERTVSLALGNNPPGQEMQIGIRKCDKDGRITREILIFPANAKLPPEENCDDHVAGAFPWPEHGGAVVTVNLDLATVETSPGAGGTPTEAGRNGLGEGRLLATIEASFLGGVTTAGNLSTTSGIEGDAAFFFGPVALALGGVRSGDTTGHRAVTGSSGNVTNVPFTSSFHAAEIKGIVKVLAVGPFSIAVQGGAWPFTARNTTTATIVVTTPTGGTSTQLVTTTRSQGGVAPVFGGSIEAGLMKHVAAQVAVKRGYLRAGNSLDQGVTMVLFGISVYPQAPRALFKIGQGAQ